MTRLRWAAAVATAAALAVGGCATEEAVPAAAGSAPAAGNAAMTPAPSPARSGPRPIPDDGTVPVRVRIPAIEVDSALETLDRDGDGRLRAPVDWQSAGWFAGGPVPGEQGPSVIAGHVDSPDGPAVFARLSALRPGDRVEVELSDGRTTVFEVDGSRTVPQAEFPTDAVYGPVPDHQLRLITCHTFDEAGGHYVDNLVVYATAVDV